MPSPYPLLACVLFLNALISEVEADIGGNHDDIREIEPECEVVSLRHELCRKSAEISKQDKAHEEQALALG